MKILSKILLALFFIIASIILFLPNILLSSKDIQQSIIKEIKKETKLNIKFEKIKWRWLASPHLTFENIAIKADCYHLTSKKIGIYPNWLEVIHGNFALKKLTLKQPYLKIVNIPPKNNKKNILPEYIIISQGTLEISKNIKFPLSFFKKQGLKVKDIDARLKNYFNGFSLYLIGKTKIISNLAVDVDYDFSKNSYKASLHLKDCDLGAFQIKRFTREKAIPKKGLVDLNLSLKGQALKNIKGEIELSSKCLISKAKKKDMFFSCGSLKGTFVFDKDNLNILVKNLEFKDPKLKLRAKIQLSGLLTPKAKKWAKIDAFGNDFDIKAIREVLLAFWKKDKDIRELCDVVRSGSLQRISLKFDAPISKLHSLSDMYIEGYAQRARIYLPDQKMFFDSVTAPFIIKDGILYVNNGVAKIRNSVGLNGQLTLGLSKGEEKLDLDIDFLADAKDVKWALAKFIKDKDAKNEIKSLSKINGKINGKLRLKGTKKHANLYIKTSKINFKLYYPYLNKNIKVNSGCIIYYNDAIKFIKFRGKLGKSKIFDITGRINWKNKNNKKLSISSLKSDILVEDIFNLWDKIEFLKEFKYAYKLNVKGIISVKKLNGSINLNQPQKIKYDLLFKAKNLYIKTNAIYTSLLVKSGLFHLTSSKFLSKTKVITVIEKRPFSVDFDLTHKNFHNFWGTFKISGNISKRAWNWLEKKGVNLNEFTPKTPFVFKNFTVKYHPQKGIEFSGNLYWKPSNITVFLDVHETDNHLHIKTFNLKTPKNKCAFSFLKEAGESKKILLSWHGKVTGEDINEILRENKLLTGVMAGDFIFGFSHKKGLKPFYQLKGKVNAKNFHWKLENNLPLIFQDLEIAFKKEHGKIKGNFILNGDTFSGNGSLKSDGQNIYMDIDISASNLSPSTFVILRKLARKSESKGIQETKIKHSSKDKGNEIDKFKIDKGLFIKALLKIENAQYPLVENYKYYLKIKKLKSDIIFKNGQLSFLSINSDDVCGLGVNLIRQKIKNDIRTRLHVKESSKGPQNFEAFFKCINYEQNTLKGPFTLELKMLGEEDVFLGKGKLAIKAWEGEIKRFVLLSKIFRVINLVDLFSTNASLLEGSSSYKKMLIYASLDAGNIHLEKAVIKGRGLNFYATGDIHILTKDLDITLFVQPLKTIDTIITSVPIVGKIIGGEHDALFVVPVKIKGDWEDPSINTVKTGVVTNLFEKLFLNFIKAPFKGAHEEDWDMKWDEFDKYFIKKKKQ